MSSEDAQKEIEKLRNEIEKREARIRELRREGRRQQVEDLEAFEAMSPAEQRELYDDDPEAYRRYMKLKQEKAERELTAEPEMGAAR